MSVKKRDLFVPSFFLVILGFSQFSGCGSQATNAARTAPLEAAAASEGAETRP